MKEILIRNLDSPSKADIKIIIDEYVQRKYVVTSALSTALETLIREFNTNEINSKDTIEKHMKRILELEEQVQQNSMYANKQKAFVNALNDLLKV